MGAERRRTLVVVGYVAGSSFFGVLGMAHFGLASLPSLWAASPLADAVFVGGMLATLFATHALARKAGVAAVPVGAVLTAVVFHAAYAVVLATARANWPPLDFVLYAGWPGIAFGGLVPWWAARQGWLAPATAPALREVVLGEA